MSDKFQAFASVVYVKMREGIFTGEEHLKQPIDLVDLRALAERDLTIRQQAEEIRLLREQRTHVYDISNDIVDWLKYRKQLDAEIEAAKGKIK